METECCTSDYTPRWYVLFADELSERDYRPDENRPAPVWDRDASYRTFRHADGPYFGEWTFS